MNKEKVIYCTICGKKINPGDAYSFKNGQIDNQHKECRIMGCYDDKPWTFFPIMQLFNIPYIENQWFQRMKSQIKITINTHQYKSIFGKYLSTMKLAGYRNFEFQDSPLLNMPNDLIKNKPIRDFLLDSDIPQEYFQIIEFKENV